MYTRGELAEKTGVGFDTLRFYENSGVLAKPERSPGNYRLYGEDAVSRLLFLKLAKRCGFSLKEIKTLLNLIDSGTDCSVDPDTVIDGKIMEINSQIAELQKMKKLLLSSKQAFKDNNCGNLLSYIDLAL